MKKLLCLIMYLTAFNLYSQINSNAVDSVELIYVSDTVSYDLNKFTADYALEMSTWSEEKLTWFFNTFCYKRGQFTIPDEPIVSPNWDD